MRIGRLRHRVTVEQERTTRDAHGGVVPDTSIPDGFYAEETTDGLVTIEAQDGALAEGASGYTVVVSAWASIEPIIGKEYFAAAKVESEVTHKIKMWYQPGVTTAMIVRFGTRIFDIVSILNVEERRRELVIMATEDV